MIFLIVPEFVFFIDTCRLILRNLSRILLFAEQCFHPLYRRFGIFILYHRTIEFVSGNNQAETIAIHILENIFLLFRIIHSCFYSIGRSTEIGNIFVEILFRSLLLTIFIHIECILVQIHLGSGKRRAMIPDISRNGTSYPALIWQT